MKLPRCLQRQKQLRRNKILRLPPFSRFIVRDRSMEPFLHQGDRVLTFNWVGPKAGDVVVFMLANKFLVKRVKKVSGEVVLVEGDNKKASSKVEPINLNQVIGKVILKY